MKSVENRIEKEIEKHRRIMRDKSVDGYTQQRHYGIFKGLRIALDIINKHKDNTEQQ